MNLISSRIEVNPINIIVSCFCLYLINFLFNSIKRIIKLPPGPWGLPIVGYLPFIRNDAHIQFSEFATKYGPVFSLKCGQYDLVVINSWELIKEAFQNDSLLDRPKQTFLPSIIKDASFSEMSGEPWRDHRRLAMSTLRNVGLGKSSMEKMIQEEIATFIKLIYDSHEKPFNFADSIALSISNNISILIFGHRDDYSDPVKLEMERSLAELNKTGHFFNAAIFLPWIADLFIFFNHLSLEKLRRLLNLIEDHVETEIEHHKKRDKTESIEVKDYIDGYLSEMKNRDDSVFTMAALRRNTSMFYTAGSDTVQTALNWIILHLVAYPEYQQRIRDEIRLTIGSERLPESSDRSQMPVTMAFIYEVHRMTTIAPISAYRQPCKDVIIGNQLIPKDCFVVFNLWGVHRDPNLWDNPNTFNPERFLNEDGSKAIKLPYLIPFSGGKRICPGESFANLQLFLYLVSIVQKFKILPKPGSTITLKANYYFTIRPEDDLNLIFSPIDD